MNSYPGLCQGLKGACCMHGNRPTGKQQHVLSHVLKDRVKSLQGYPKKEIVGEQWCVLLLSCLRGTYRVKQGMVSDRTSACRLAGRISRA